MECIIIDDEPMARKGMKRLVESREELRLAAMLDSAGAAADWLGQNETDLIFLDIEMPGINGIEFARSLPPRSMVIFTTAYQEYALESYEVEAIDYLLKPIDPVRFNMAVDRAVAYKSLLDKPEDKEDPVETDFIIVKADRRYVRVRLVDILYIEGLKDYVIIHMNDHKVVTRMTIKGIEDILPARMFLRVSRSYIVNKDRIDSFDNNDINIGTSRIGIGISYRDSVLSELLE